MDSLTKALAFAVALPVLLGGCEQSAHSSEDGVHNVEKPVGAVAINKLDYSSLSGIYALKMKDAVTGQKVDCVFIDSNNAGGLSCDWTAAAGTAPNLSLVSKERVAFFASAGFFAMTIKGEKFDRERDVSCIYVDNNKAGGLSCNWESSP